MRSCGENELIETKQSLGLIFWTLATKTPKCLQVGEVEPQTLVNMATRNEMYEQTQRNRAMEIAASVAQDGSTERTLRLNIQTIADAKSVVLSQLSACDAIIG